MTPLPTNYFFNFFHPGHSYSTSHHHPPINYKDTYADNSTYDVILFCKNKEIIWSEIAVFPSILMSSFQSLDVLYVNDWRKQSRCCWHKHERNKAFDTARSKTRKTRKFFSEIFKSEFSILAIGQNRKLGNKKTRNNISEISEISEVSEFSICHFFIFFLIFFFVLFFTNVFSGSLF